MADRDIYVATKTFVLGSGETVRKGVTRVRAGHPIMRGREGSFELLEVQYDVESAEARPSQARRRKVKAAPKVKAEVKVEIKGDASKLDEILDKKSTKLDEKDDEKDDEKAGGEGVPEPSESEDK